MKECDSYWNGGNDDLQPRQASIYSVYYILYTYVWVSVWVFVCCWYFGFSTLVCTFAPTKPSRLYRALCL